MAIKITIRTLANLAANALRAERAYYTPELKQAARTEKESFIFAAKLVASMNPNR